MKKLIFVFVITFLLALSFNAWSADETYFGVNFGMASVDEDGVDTGFLGSIAYGAEFDEYRLDGEVLFQSNDIDYFNDSVDTFGFLINGYYDFSTEGDLKPYISAGIGYARATLGSNDDSGFLYEVGVGVGYPLSETTMLDIRYRYYGLEIDDADINGHSGLAGIRFKF